MGAKDQIHVAVGLTHLFRHFAALRHAAAQADDLLRVCLLGVGQCAQCAVDTLFGMVTDGAGVEHYDIGLLDLLRQLAAHGAQHTHDILAVGHVLLAAKGIHQRFRRYAAHLMDGADLLFKIALAGHLGLVQQYQFSIQNKPPNRLYQKRR